MADYVEPATLKNTCSEIYDRFNNMPDLIAIPVVEDFRPIGLLKRIDFLIHLASRYGRPLYGKQSVSVLMDKTPLVVESIMTIADLNKHLMFKNQAAIQEGLSLFTKAFMLGSVQRLISSKLMLKMLKNSLRTLEKQNKRQKQQVRLKQDFLPI